MGQQSTRPRNVEQYVMDHSDEHQITQQLSNGLIVKHKISNEYKFIKQLSYTSQEDYQHAYIQYLQMISHRSEHLLKLEDVKIKAQNTFCSTFYKIMLVYEYVQYNLQDEINNRIEENRKFDEREIWSVLCSCVLAMSHLEKIHQVHSGLEPHHIKLTKDGVVKLQPLEILQNHNQISGPYVLTITILNCLSLRDYSAVKDLEQEIRSDRIKCSEEMKNILLIMLTTNINFIKLEEELFKLIQDDDMISVVSNSHNNTPILKSHNNSKPKTSYKNTDEKKQDRKEDRKEDTRTQENYHNSSKIEVKKQPKRILKSPYDNYVSMQLLKPSDSDTNDEPSSYHQPPQQQVENPDQNQSEDQNNSQDILNKQMANHNEQLEKQSSREQSERHMSTQLTESLTKIRLSINNINNIVHEDHPNMKKNQQSSTFNSQNINEVSKNNTQDQNKYNNIFTDPSLLYQIKSDLQHYQYRKTLADVNHIHQVDKFKVETIREVEGESPISEQKINQKQIQSTKRNNLSTPNNITNTNNIISKYNTNNTNNVNNITNTTNNNNHFDNHNNVNKVEKNDNIMNDNIINDNTIGFKKEVKDNKSNKIHSQPQYKFKEKITNSIINEQQQSFKSSRVNINTSILNKEETHQQFNHKIIQRNKVVNVPPPPSNQSSSSSLLNNNLSLNNSIEKINVKSRPIYQKSSEKQLEYSRQNYARGKYEGTKLNNMRHGHGTFYYSEGGKYVGQWYQNRMHGYGVLYYPNQQIAYEGQWKFDQLCGKGVLYNEDVTALEGNYDYRNWDDVQEFWIKYEGQFLRDNKCGKGKLYLVNGQMFQGQFDQDEINGEGIFRRKDGCVIRGIWRNNKLIKLL